LIPAKGIAAASFVPAAITRVVAVYKLAALAIVKIPATALPPDLVISEGCGRHSHSQQQSHDDDANEMSFPPRMSHENSS
jgi:hypothetical protein